MSGSERRKGREGENEARKVFNGGVFEVLPVQPGQLGREDSGDFWLIHGDGDAILMDAKRRNKVRVLEWSRAIEATAARVHFGGVSPVGASIWRPDSEPWRVTLLAEDFVRLVAR